MNIAITAVIALVALVLGLTAGYFYRKNTMEKTQKRFSALPASLPSAILKE